MTESDIEKSDEIVKLNNEIYFIVILLFTRSLQENIIAL